MKIFLWSLVAIIIAGGALFFFKQNVNEGPGPYDGFAQCLKDKGAVFYGASWCPHCIDQKAEFGTSAHLLPYVECSTPDGNRQTQICTDKKIEGYPTWIFADGSRDSGKLSWETLSQKTGCPLPTRP